MIVQRDGTSSAFLGSLNETREGWQEHYELVWEDTLGGRRRLGRGGVPLPLGAGVPLPDAIIEEVGRCARKREVELDELEPGGRRGGRPGRGPALSPGRAAHALAARFRRASSWNTASDTDASRFLLADEVGVGKTLSLATSALVSCLLGDGPVLILAPATLGQQWQVELKDKLGIPSAVWLSNRKVWLDPNGHLIKTRGPEDIGRCPFQIGIVSTGLIVPPDARIPGPAAAQLRDPHPRRGPPRTAVPRSREQGGGAE